MKIFLWNVKKFVASYKYFVQIAYKYMGLTKNCHIFTKFELNNWLVSICWRLTSTYTNIVKTELLVLLNSHVILNYSMLKNGFMAN